MNNSFTIRLETENDYHETEKLTFKAFETMKLPERQFTNEHFFVHLLRQDKTFISKLDFIAEQNNQIIGNIMYNASPIAVNSAILDKVIMLAVLSVLPAFHNQGIGSALIKHSILKAKQLGYKAILVCGHPEYYKKFGFISADHFGLKWIDGSLPDFFLVLEIEKDYLKTEGGSWALCDSITICNDKIALNAFQTNFEK